MLGFVELALTSATSSTFFMIQKVNTYVEKPIYIIGLTCYYVLTIVHYIEIGGF